MYRFSDFPPQTIRDTITEVISTFDIPMGLVELSEHVFELLEVSEPIHIEQQSKIESIAQDMVLAGRLKIENDLYSLGDTRKDGNEETYHVNYLPSPTENLVTINGNMIAETIGSEYYPEAWMDVKDINITVELIPEPQNPYDSNAVAVTINNKLVGHLTRTIAQKYFKTIVELNNSGYSLQVDGEVLESPNNQNYRFIQLAMPTIEAIEKLY